MKKKSTSKLVRHSLGEDGSAPARRPVLRSSSATEGGSPWRAAVFERRRLGEGGFFNLRVLIGLLVVLAGVLLALLGIGTFSNASAQANLDRNAQQGAGQMTVIPAVHSDLSPPLRDQPVVWPQAGEEREPNVPLRIPIKHKDAPDPVIQNSFWQRLMTLPAVPGPIRQWPGMGKPCFGCTIGIPPDTNGAVGKAQYVQMVNVGLQVFDKLTGTSLFGPIPIRSVWFGFGGTCQAPGRGDPIVVYDRLADRWVISQFAIASGAPDHVQDECIAVSQTGDATGAWYRYQFHLTDASIQDYPKFGVWPDGYYMSANVAVPGDGLFPQPFVFDRSKMLVGDPTATFQTPGVISPEDEIFVAGFLPSDLDGILPPPLGAANHFVQFPEQDEAGSLIYKVWAFHVDWDHSANSSFRVQARIPAAGFTRLVGERVPQLGTSQLLDAIGDRLMFRNAYRRFPDGHESLLNNFTVGANSVAGIRWFELHRAPPGNWTLRQESTYQPDSSWRWMGSIASDNQGNIALGFSASSPTIHPQIRYAGRLAIDPLNILSGEQHLFDGTGSQENNRWGDYSDMTVDPVDDCTFYYTNEYYATTTSRDWQTRIGYFRFTECAPPQKGTAHFVVCDRGAPLSNALVSIDGRAYGASATDGTYDAVLPPGSHTYAVSKPSFATKTGNFTVTNGQTTRVDLCPGGGGGGGLTIIQPNGGEVWSMGSVHDIKWDSTNMKHSDHLILQYSRDGGAGWFRIAQDIPAFTFGYRWQVDNFPTTQGRVKILLQEDRSITDQSDANFTVQRRPYITLLRPNGGESWTIGQYQNIHWSRQNPGGNTVDIDYSTDNGTTWIRIAKDAEDTGFYLWNVPGPATTTAKVRIRFHQTLSLADTSDAVFTIVSP